jgi:hypothetical protein
LKRYRVGAVVSHISRKTSEIWGTPGFAARTSSQPEALSVEGV